MKPRHMPKTMPLYLAVVLLAGVALCASPARAAGANTYTVCASGCDFTTIQAALDDARVTAGDTIQVADAVHTEAGITVRKDVTIEGQGAEETIVQAHPTLEESPDRVFLIAEGATVTIRDLTIRHGNPQPGEEYWRCGGGIANLGTLTVESCVVHNNTGNDGGGIYSRVGTLTVLNTTIRNNVADRIAVEADRTNPTASSTWACGSGGGIKLSQGGTLALVNSTVHDNEAKSHGGGIFVACDATANLTSSTVSGNRATTWGGGLHAKGVIHCTNCTVANNEALGECAAGQMADRCPKGDGGGGVFVRATLHFTNTIIANNGKGLDCVLGRAGEYGMTVPGAIGANVNNLVGDGSCEADYTGDPMLGPLADNGGPVWTHALLPGSPAIDVLAADFCTITTDERGQPRPVACEAPDTPGDLGAFELQADQWSAPAGLPGTTQPAPVAAETEAPTAPVAGARGDWTLGTLGLVGLLLFGLGGLAGVWLRRRGP